MLHSAGTIFRRINLTAVKFADLRTLITSFPLSWFINIIKSSWFVDFYLRENSGLAKATCYAVEFGGFPTVDYTWLVFFILLVVEVCSTLLQKVGDTILKLENCSGSDTEAVEVTERDSSLLSNINTAIAHWDVDFLTNKLWQNSTLARALKWNCLQLFLKVILPKITNNFLITKKQSYYSTGTKKLLKWWEVRFAG